MHSDRHLAGPQFSSINYFCLGLPACSHWRFAAASPQTAVKDHEMAVLHGKCVTELLSRETHFLLAASELCVNSACAKPALQQQGGNTGEIHTCHITNYGG